MHGTPGSHPPLPPLQSPLVGLGMTSMVLGAVGMLLVIFPVLGVPISAVGLAFGLVGVAVGIPRGGLVLRWSLGGVMGSALALAVNLAVTYAPSGYLPGQEVPKYWEQPHGRPYVPPPAT